MDKERNKDLNSPERRDSLVMIGKALLASLLLMLPLSGKNRRSGLKIRLHRKAVARRTGGAK
jgi:hypothetical protein